MLLNSNNKSRTSWQIIKNLTKNRTNSEVSLKPADPTKLTNEFNNCFAEIATSLTRNVSKFAVPPTVPRLENSFYMFEISQEAVISVVCSFKNKDSYGYDEIPIKVIKTSIGLIVEPLTHIINRSLKEGIFPDNSHNQTHS